MQTSSVTVSKLVVIQLLILYPMTGLLQNMKVIAWSVCLTNFID